MQIPLPNDRWNNGSIVIASCWLRDDNDEPFLGLLMLLNPDAPYYTIREIISEDHATWENVAGAVEYRRNINEATEVYADSGGDI